jgi:hypothetical protein
VSRPASRRGLREVKRRQGELVRQAARQRADLARDADGLARFFRLVHRGWILIGALRAGLSLARARRP